MDGSQVALLIGVPVSWEEFRHRSKESDWLAKFISKDQEEAKQLIQLRRGWDRQYSKSTALPYLNLADDCTKRGMHVRTRATLGDVYEATRCYDAVIILGHWKGPEIANGDLIRPIVPAAFIARASEGTGEIPKWLTRALPRALPREKQSFWRALLPERKMRSLGDILNECLDAEIEREMPPRAGVDMVVEADITRRTRRRAVLDQLFEGLISPANRLELFDGLYDIDAVDAAISPDFKGILDLTLCTSTPLADRIAASRRHAPRVVQFQDTIQPFLAALYLGATVRLLADGHSYLAARDEGRHIVNQELRKALTPSL